MTHIPVSYINLKLREGQIKRKQQQQKSLTHSYLVEMKAHEACLFLVITPGKAGEWKTYTCSNLYVIHLLDWYNNHESHIEVSMCSHNAFSEIICSVFQ